MEPGAPARGGRVGVVASEGLVTDRVALSSPETRASNLILFPRGMLLVLEFAAVTTRATINKHQAGSSLGYLGRLVGVWYVFVTANGGRWRWIGKAVRTAQRAT